MTDQDIILKFLEITGNTRDSEIFLKNFRAQSPEKFALIYIPNEVLSISYLTFLYDLKFLYSLNLFPSIVIEKKSEDFVRSFHENLFKEFNSKGNFSQPPFEIIKQNNTESDEIKRSISLRKIPILIFDETTTSYIDYLEKISNQLLVNKIIILRENSGLKMVNSKQNISLINLETDFEKLSVLCQLEENDKSLLLNAKKILDNTNNLNISFAITSPISLLRELFTIKGSGTYIKKGSKIQRYKKFSEVDSKKLKSLIENAFRKIIRDDFFNREITAILLESDYRGAAIFQETKYGTLLSKFAVDEIARGEGVGRDIWDKMKLEFKTFFWRANPKNSINSWYQKESDGFQKYKNWNIYWIGLDVDMVENICKFLTSIETDFLE